MTIDRDKLRAALPDNHGVTCWDDCYLVHPWCAVRRLLEEGEGAERPSDGDGCTHEDTVESSDGDSVECQGCGMGSVDLVADLRTRLEEAKWRARRHELYMEEFERGASAEADSWMARAAAAERERDEARERVRVLEEGVTSALDRARSAAGGCCHDGCGPACRYEVDDLVCELEEVDATTPAREEGGSHYRGHPIERQGDGYVYSDTGEPVPTAAERACGHCDCWRTTEGHDGCIGTLPDPVQNACCGHGQRSEAYVQYRDGSDVRGEAAIAVIDYHLRAAAHRGEGEGGGG